MQRISALLWYELGQALTRKIPHLRRNKCRNRGHPQSCTGSFLLLRHRGLNLAVRQAGTNLIAKIEGADILQELALGIKYKRVSTFKNGHRRQRLEGGLQTLAAHSMLKEDVAHDGDQGRGSAVHFLANSGKHPAQIVMTNGCGNHFPSPMRLLDQLALIE